MSFETTTEVRFAHVDGAGIVFYPRYFEMLNAAVEDWFARRLGVDFRTLHLDRGLGVPTVDLHAEFLAPCILGDDLTVRITPRKVGRSSCTYEAVFTGEGRDRVKVHATLVCMDLVAKKAVSWPDDIRAHLLDDLVPAE